MITVYITNLNGKPVNGIHISDAHDQKVLDTRNWKAGIYIATLKINDKITESDGEGFAGTGR